MTDNNTVDEIDPKVLAAQQKARELGPTLTFDDWLAIQEEVGQRVPGRRTVEISSGDLLTELECQEMVTHRREVAGSLTTSEADVLHFVMTCDDVYVDDDNRDVVSKLVSRGLLTDQLPADATLWGCGVYQGICHDRNQRLREAVRFFYDLQKLRIQQGNRAGSETIMLDGKDKEFHDTRSQTLAQLEKNELKNITRLVRKEPIYKWLKAQKGIGPTMSGVLLSEIDIRRCETVSALWKFCGLDVQNGHAPRRTKGQKLTYNSWLRTKVVGVAADCMIKAGSDWRQHYDNYKLRKQSMSLEVCMGCEGTKKALKGENKGKKCKNCKGTGGPAPWGESDGHRHRAALRYMMKMFLQSLWKEWRAAEGLEIVAPYAEAVLGRVHGDHGGMGASLH